MNGKVKGLYLRSQGWWYAIQRDGKRTWISLETKDEKEAIVKAMQMKSLFIDQVGGWDAEVEAYIVDARASGRDD